MFQDIDPHAIAYDPARQTPEEHDRVVFLKDGHVLLAADGGSLSIPTLGAVREALGGVPGNLVYLFTVAGESYHYAPDAVQAFGPFAYGGVRTVLAHGQSCPAFVIATAHHLAAWYASNRYCGTCSQPFHPRENERALHCPTCGVVKYPRISPVVIVGICDGDSLLLAKSATGEYRNYGLISGFVEPGETLEAAMAREVMEEVGLRIRNPRYYKSQPWAFSQSLLMGFFADLDGDGAVTLNTAELSEATWFTRSGLPGDQVRLSLTWDMIQAFHNGEV